MLRLVPMGCFDDMAEDYCGPSMDCASNIIRLMRPYIPENRRRRRFYPFQAGMLRRNPYFQLDRHSMDSSNEEESADSEAEEWIYQLSLPTFGKNSKTRRKKSSKISGELTKGKNATNSSNSDANATEHSTASVEKEQERTVAIARPLQPQTFSVRLDVSGYKPDNIAVKIRNRVVVVNAKHQETDPDSGVFIQRELHRSYILPSHVNPDAVVSSLDNDGVLTVEAPCKSQEKPAEIANEPEAEDAHPGEKEIQDKINNS